MRDLMGGPGPGNVAARDRPGSSHPQLARAAGLPDRAQQSDRQRLRPSSGQLDSRPAAGYYTCVISSR
jgi:hypothetical protein